MACVCLKINQITVNLMCQGNMSLSLFKPILPITKPSSDQFKV